VTSVDPGPQPNPASPRQRILSATLALIAGSGFAGVSIASVATTAGVSRQTVYKHFGSAPDLIAEAIAAVVGDIIAGFEKQLEAYESPVEYIEELIVASRAATRDHPVMAWLLRAQQTNPILQRDMMDRAIGITTGLMRPLADRDPVVAVALDDIMEMVIRWGMSIILFGSPDTETDEGLREFLRRWVRPALRDTLTRAAVRAVRAGGSPAPGD
jgi:AcrR family transcriptional regulator